MQSTVAPITRRDRERRSRMWKLLDRTRRATLIAMRGRVWSSVSAGIGAAILVVLYFYGMEYGTWLDEVGRLDTSPPSVVLPFIIGGLGLLLLIGGLVVTFSSVRTSSAPRDHS